MNNEFLCKLMIIKNDLIFFQFFYKFQLNELEYTVDQYEQGYAPARTAWRHIPARTARRHFTTHSVYKFIIFKFEIIEKVALLYRFSVFHENFSVQSAILIEN